MQNISTPSRRPDQPPSQLERVRLTQLRELIPRVPVYTPAIGQALRTISTEKLNRVHPGTFDDFSVKELEWPSGLANTFIQRLEAEERQIQPSASTATAEKKPQEAPAVAEGIQPSLMRLADITLDGSIQTRANINPLTCTGYSLRMTAGDQFPPIVVFQDGQRFLLADGFHRHRAAELANLTSFPVEIHQGTRLDALVYAIKANAKHGLPLTSEDKRRTISLALAGFPDLSDRLIADLCSVSHTFVANVRTQLATVASSTPRQGRDGKRRKQPQSKIPRGKTVEASQAIRATTPDMDSDPAEPVMETGIAEAQRKIVTIINNCPNQHLSQLVPWLREAANLIEAGQHPLAGSY